MKIRIRNLVVAAVFVLTLTAGFFAGCVTAGERQPHMRGALESLRTAKRELAVADNDKGGHRGKALNLVNSAISEVEAGISFDNRH
ncbi:MAG: hypothetical protein ABI718_07640 [Acidobacteriota bacterium]